MRKIDRNRARSRKTQKRAYRSRKRTSKRLYKKSLRKNKYNSRKSRSHMKGGRPTHGDADPGKSQTKAQSALARVGSRLNEKQQQRRREFNPSGSEEERQELIKTKRRLTGQKRKRSPKATTRMKARLYLKRKRNEGSLKKGALGTLGLGAAATAGVLAAPSLAALGLGAAATAGLYGIKKGYDATGLQDYSFDRIERDNPEKSGEIIFKLTDKTYNNNNFFLITQKNSQCIDQFIGIMNEAYTQTKAAMPVDARSSADETSSEESTDDSDFPLKTISEKEEPLDTDILQGELELESALSLGQDETKQKNLLNQKYDQKLDSISVKIAAAFHDTEIDSFELYKAFKQAILKYFSSSRRDCDIKLNQWVLGYREEKNKVHIVLTDLSGQERESIAVELPKERKENGEKALREFSEGQKLNIKKKKLKDLCEKLVYEVNIGNVDSGEFIAALDGINHKTNDELYPVKSKYKLEGDLDLASVTNFERGLPQPTGLSAANAPVSATAAAETPPPSSPAQPSSEPAQPSDQLPLATSLPAAVETPQPRRINFWNFLKTIDYSKLIKLKIKAFRYDGKIYIECHLIQNGKHTFLPPFRTKELKEWIDGKLDVRDDPDREVYEELSAAMALLKGFRQDNVKNKVSSVSAVFEYLVLRGNLDYLFHFFNQRHIEDHSIIKDLDKTYINIDDSVRQTFDFLASVTPVAQAVSAATGTPGVSEAAKTSGFSVPSIGPD